MFVHIIIHITDIYGFRRQASQDFYQSFVHLLCCTLEEFTTTCHKKRVPCMDNKQKSDFGALGHKRSHRTNSLLH